MVHMSCRYILLTGTNSMKYTYWNLVLVNIMKYHRSRKNAQKRQGYHRASCRAHVVNKCPSVELRTSDPSFSFLVICVAGVVIVAFFRHVPPAIPSSQVPKGFSCYCCWWWYCCSCLPVSQCFDVQQRCYSPESTVFRLQKYLIYSTWYYYSGMYVSSVRGRYPPENARYQSFRLPTGTCLNIRGWKHPVPGISYRIDL